jgi:hypothetical protein
MKYYAEYLIDLCVPWPDESLPFFERSAKGFCLLVHVWSSKSATFIECQHFCFLSNFMSKGYQSSHNKTAATAWRQHNTNWWSEMKTAKHDTSPLAKAMGKATDLDDEAAGRLSSTNLYCITMAALEGQDKRRLAYHALKNNYTSLMCSSNLTHHIHKATPPSPVFMQHNTFDNTKLSKSISSLKDMRTAIHKLLPEDLENPIKENVAFTSLDPMRAQLKITLVPLLSHAHVVHTKSYLKLFIKPSQWNSLNILFTKFGGLISPLNSGQN